VNSFGKSWAMLTKKKGFVVVKKIIIKKKVTVG